MQEEGKQRIPFVKWEEPDVLDESASPLCGFFKNRSPTEASQARNEPQDEKGEIDRLRNTVQILSEVVAFYENCTRVVLLRMEKLSTDGHTGEDTHLYCAIPYREDGKTRAFCFILEVYSESGSLGIEHWAKYKPDPSNPQYPGRLEKFNHELVFEADQIRQLFTELVGQFDLS